MRWPVEALADGAGVPEPALRLLLSVLFGEFLCIPIKNKPFAHHSMHIINALSARDVIWYIFSRFCVSVNFITIYIPKSYSYMLTIAHHTYYISNERRIIETCFENRNCMCLRDVFAFGWTNIIIRVFIK